MVWSKVDLSELSENDGVRVSEIASGDMLRSLEWGDEKLFPGACIRGRDLPCLEQSRIGREGNEVILETEKRKSE